MKRFKTNRMFFSAGAILIGLILLIWPASSLMIIGKCLGVLLAAGGVASGIFYLKDHESAAQTALLVLGVIMIICGVVIFLHPYDLVRLIPSIMGVLVLVSGIVNLMETFTLSKRKYSKWWVSLIISLITIGAGIFLVKYAFDLVAIITRIAGGILLFDGVSDLWVTSRVLSSSKESAVDGVIVSEKEAAEEGTDSKTPQGAEAQKAETPKAAEASVKPQPAASQEAPAESSVKPQPAAAQEAPVESKPAAAQQVPVEPQPAADQETPAMPQTDAKAEDGKGKIGISETANSDIPEYMLYMDADNDLYDGGDSTP